MNFKAFILLFIMVVSVGCKEQEELPIHEGNSAWRESALFRLHLNGQNVKYYELRGKEGKIGFLDAPLYAGKEQKVMWYLWGNAPDLVGKKVKGIATHKESETSVDPFVMIDDLKAGMYGATAHARSVFSLPLFGLWRIDIYVDDALFETLFVRIASTSDRN